MLRLRRGFRSCAYCGHLRLRLLLLLLLPLRAAAPAASTEEPVATVVEEETAGPLSPLVRKMARENKIDLQQGQRAQVRVAASPSRIWKLTCQVLPPPLLRLRRLHPRPPRPLWRSQSHSLRFPFQHPRRHLLANPRRWREQLRRYASSR